MHRLPYLRLINLRFIIFLVVLAFAFILRAHNYERVPTAANLDEQLYALSGVSLIETGTPVSWSTLDYPKSAEVYKGIISYKGGDPKAGVTLYKPWLDEPPVFSLLVGWFAHMNGVNRNDFVPSSYIRIPVIFISTLTSILIFLIAKKIGGFWRGILAMLVYSTVPIMVFASRMAMPETLIAFLLTLMVYLLMLFWQKPNIWYIIPIPLLVGVAGLSKPTGYFLLLLALYFTFLKLYKINQIKKAFKYCLYLVLAMVPFIAAYFLYGLHYDAGIFKIIYNIQAHRPVGFGSLAWFFISPAVDTAIINDGWFVFCLVSAVYFVFTIKDDLKRFITISFVFSILVVMFTGGQADLLAWYRYPIYPFLAILGAWGIELLISRADFIAAFFAVGMMLGGRRLLVNAFRPDISPSAYRLSLSILLAPSLVNTILNKNWLKKISRLIIIGVLATGIWFNVKYIYNAYELDCQSKTCVMVPTTALSKLYFPLVWRFFILK
jgi:4-amino-4-deoxy-L-arabinose transferase-like glycosyltransferase